MNLFPGKKKILFYIAIPMNYAVLSPIYETLKNDERLSIYFTFRFLEKKRGRKAYMPFNQKNSSMLCMGV